MDTSLLKIDKVSKTISDENGIKINLFRDISFEVNKSDFISILASSSTGKSTLLKIIANIEQPDEGNIVNLNNSKIVYIPSSPSSFPWMTVKENIKIAAGNDANENHVNKCIKDVGLEGYENHIPNNASLGFRFRISLARALSVKPEIILLDDPFEKFDRETKFEIYSLLNELSCKEKYTFILSTTNITEALFLSDKIHILINRPAKLNKTINVDFHEIRTSDLVFSNNFIAKRIEIEKIFQS